jgi:hypothetical protein
VKKIISWIADNILWSLLLAPAFTAWLKGYEWASELPSIVDYVYNFALTLFGEAAFPWISGMLLGIALGIFLQKFITWLGSTLSQNEKLFVKLEELSADVLFNIHNSKIIHDRHEKAPRLFAVVQRLFSEMQRHNIDVPALDPASTVDFRDSIKAYINYLRPFFSDRDIRIVRMRASEWLSSNR